MIIRIVNKLNSIKKGMLFLFIWLLFGIFSPVHAEYPSDTDKLTGAEDLTLRVGKSFVLECSDRVMRVAVGSPGIADVVTLNAEKILINARHAGVTNLIVWYDNDSTDVYNITVKYDISEINRNLKEMVPEAKVKVAASRAGMLVVDGYVDDQDTLDRVLRVLQAFEARDSIKNLMRLRGPQQVQLEVKIAEISRSDIKRFGLGWLSNRSASEHQVGVGVFGGGEAAGALHGNQTSGSTLSYAMALASPFTNAFQIAVTVLDKDIMSIISLLKSMGLATVMAKPTLVTMSGQGARFHVGGSFPVPYTGSLGATGFQNQEYGVELKFVPTVVGRETINLEVATSVSDIDYSTAVESGGAMVPGIISRAASTTLQLKDGQSFVVAGLLKETVHSTINKVPFLGDIPLLGVAFRRKEYVKRETELVIIVTPRLVKAMNYDEIPPIPGESMDSNQGDFEFFFLDRLWTKKNPGPEKTPRFCGPIGFES